MVREEFDNEATQDMVIAYLEDLVDFHQTHSTGMSYKDIIALENAIEVVKGYTTYFDEKFHEEHGE